MRTGTRLNLENPTTFNEKLQWLKIHNRRPEYTKMVDKYEVRQYIADTLGEEYLIPLLGVWNSPGEIEFDKLPNQFVLKCTHDSGSVIICNDKSQLNIPKVKKKLKKFLRREHFWRGREWPYKDTVPRIIAEQYMVDDSGVELKDFKFYCFDGEAKIIEVDFDRYQGHKRNFYDMNWELSDLEIGHKLDSNKMIPKPKCLSKMTDISERLSESIPHVRIDFYLIRERIYFGEITFYHGSGFQLFSSRDWEKKMGDWIKLA